jgi:hypothetical protein
MDDQPAPTIDQIESLLSKARPRPTARLSRLTSDAPWKTQPKETQMNRLKRLDFIVASAALILIAFIAIFLLSNRSPDQPTTAVLPQPTTETAAPTEELPISVFPTPVPEANLLWSATLTSPASGLAYQETDGNGRLFVANGELGIQIFNIDGDHLDTIPVIDPETNQPVFVRDVVWSQLLWLGPPEAGLTALTDPFQGGSYLHHINPDDGTIINSTELNSNIALIAAPVLISESTPTQLVTNGEGELFTDRIFNFAAEKEGQPPLAYHYLLRLILDGRVLNSFLVNEEAEDAVRPNIIAALSFQTQTDRLYAAVFQGANSIIEKYTLTGTPRRELTLDDEIIRWQENVALSSDSQGYTYILIDSPAHIVELDQDDQIINIFGFLDQPPTAVETLDETAVTHWLPGALDQPLALAVSPDGTMLFIIDQTRDQTKISAYIR